MLRTTSLIWILGPIVASCATATPGARPHDMSAAEHTRAAQAHAGTAQGHAAQYDPDATEQRGRCGPRSAGAAYAGGAPDDVCWRSVVNPTDTHLREAEQHRRHAADHRAASAALRDAEARACTGIAPDDRDISPFQHPEDVTDVTPLVLAGADARATGKAPDERLLGAVVTFRAVPGLTAEWLQRVVDCHLARNAALGHSVPEMPNCPLVPRGVRAQVRSVGDGFAVEIRADDPATAREILARAQRLRTTPGK